MATTEFQVAGMTCGHCEMAIRAEVEKVPGVEQVQVSAQTGILVVTSREAVDDAAVRGAVDDAGYTVVRV